MLNTIDYIKCTSFEKESFLISSKNNKYYFVKSPILLYWKKENCIKKIWIDFYYYKWNKFIKNFKRIIISIKSLYIK
jgi:hypothetical protein